MPLLDALMREQKWICPIQQQVGDKAYHVRGENGYIVIPKKGQFNSGENFYSTLLHEMAHSTGEPAYLNREKAGFSVTKNMQGRTGSRTHCGNHRSGDGHIHPYP